MENILIFRILVRTLNAIHKDNAALDPDEVEIVINITYASQLFIVIPEMEEEMIWVLVAR